MSNKPFDICKTVKAGQLVKEVVFKESAPPTLPNSCVNHVVASNDRDKKILSLGWDFNHTFSYTDVKEIKL